MCLFFFSLFFFFSSFYLINLTSASATRRSTSTTQSTSTSTTCTIYRYISKITRDIPLLPSVFFFFDLGVSSIKSVSKGKLSGRMMHRTLFPRTLRLSKLTGSLFFTVIFTVFKCVFILISTPVIVPWTTVPFFNSIETVSLFSFIKNL